MKLLLAFLLLYVSATSSLTDDYCERDTDGSCKAKEGMCENDDEPCFLEESKDKYSAKSNYPHFEHLSRLNGVKVGHEQEYEVDGVKLKLITRALKPLLFEVPNAITEDEMEHMIALATNNYRSGGLFSSKAKGGLTPEDTFKPSAYRGRGEGPSQYYSNWDLDEDGRISLEEVGLFARNFQFLYFEKEDVLEMIQKIGLPEFEDGYCDKSEFNNLNTYGIENYLNVAMREHPKWRQRTSDQTWLPLNEAYDPLMSKMRERFGKLLKVPHKILLGSEHLQVARYEEGGHYHAHHDSETEKEVGKPCCHQTSTKTVQGFNKCRLCRFITIMGYIQAPQAGGETAFLAADNITYSDGAFRHFRDDAAKDYLNLSKHCQDANLVVTPKKGTAMVWYNHHVDSSGWLGELDDFSIHGGCEVKKGTKWIMNSWLTAPYKGHVDELSMYSLEYAEKTNKEQM